MTHRSQRRSGVVMRLLSFSVPVSRAVAGAIVLRIVNQGIGIGLLGFAGAVVGARIWPAVGDGISPATGGLPVPGSAAGVIGVLAVAAVVKAVARYLEQYVGHWAAFRVLGLLRASVYDHLQAHSARVAAAERTGDLVSRVMADVDRTEVFFAHTLAPAAAALVLGAGSVAAMAVAAGAAPAAILAVGLAAVALGWPAIVARRSSGDARASRAVLGELNAVVVDLVLGIREILTHRVDARQRIDDPGLRYDALQRRRARVTGVGDACVDLTIAASLLGILLVSPPVVVPFALALAAGAFGPALAFSLVYADAESTLEAARRVFRLFDDYPVSSQPAVQRPTFDGEPGLAFDGVWFSYSNADDPPDWVHRGLSLTAPPGELTVVIGPSGCGKSTIVPLVLGWYTPQRGRVGWTAGSRPPDDLIAVMPQRSFVLRGTLRENLLVARPDATDDELRRACDDAALSDWLSELPRGLDTELGVGDTTISGGERRRIALARLIVRNAALEIYDEPTAHLDPENAEAVHRRILESRATRIVITHDPALTERADRVYHVRDGVVIDGVVIDGEPAARAAGGGTQWR